MRYSILPSVPKTWGRLLDRLVACKQIIESDSDMLYIHRFRKKIAPELYRMHVDSNYVSCALCRYLKKSCCHSNCFRCSLGIYEKCSCLLPGPPAVQNPASGIENHVPWLFKTPCLQFQRNPSENYTRNMEYGGMSSVITNYETIEGIFFGTCNGSRPCHICATVKLSLFTECPEAGRQKAGQPCDLIFERIEAALSSR